ncbi:MAG: thiamine pyrophosphate-binding protein [Pseudomonadota bacterium]
MADMHETASEIIARRLAETGCRHAFGLPGGEVLALLSALNRAGVEFTLCKHENAAGFMAEGSWQATGAPGILLTTIGPGLANGLNSVANAYQEQVPLVVLSGCIGPGEGAGFTHQVVDQTALLRPITKAQFQIADGAAQLMIDKAISIALADPPGPVHVDLPHDLAGKLMPSSSHPLVHPEPAAWADGPSFDRAVSMLSASERPLVIAGVGAVHHKAGASVLRFAEQFGAPFITTYKAKGIVSETHGHCLGGHGLSPLSDKTILPLIAQSDCVVLAGYDPIEMRSGWVEPFAPEKAVDLAHADCQHGMHASAVRHVGNVAAALERLCDAVEAKATSWPGGEPESARQVLSEQFASKPHWGPHQVFATLRECVSDETVVTIDSGAHRILLSQMWRAEQPATLLQSTAFCTMGVSLPLAMGYARAGDGQRVFAVVGDAGLEMVAGELATLRDLNLPVTIVVLVDESLALIDLKQRRSQLPESGVGFGGTDFVAVAEAYGGRGYWIDNKEDLAARLTEEAPGFSLLACRVEKMEYDGAF